MSDVDRRLRGEGYIPYYDSLGRRNSGFKHINSNRDAYSKKQFNKRMMFSVSQEDYDLVVARAKQRNVTISEQIRTYITWGIEVDSKK